MLFMHRGKSGALNCLILFHVDDALISWSPDFDIEDIKTMFVWGLRQTLHQSNVNISFHGP